MLGAHLVIRSGGGSGLKGFVQRGDRNAVGRWEPPVCAASHELFLGL